MCALRSKRLDQVRSGLIFSPTTEASARNLRGTSRLRIAGAAQRLSMFDNVAAPLGTLSDNVLKTQLDWTL
jgi:hypothetical protein